MKTRLSEKQIRKIVRKILVERSSFTGFAGFRSTDVETKEIDGVEGKVSTNVNFGNDGNEEKRKRAWNYLSNSKLLPQGTILTSAFRTQEDQDAIIKKYAEKENIDIDSSNLDSAYEKLKEKDYVIARRVGPGHGGLNGINAFDLSGADIDQIEIAVRKFNTAHGGKVKFRIIKEPKNNAVHIEYNLSSVN